MDPAADAERLVRQLVAHGVQDIGHSWFLRQHLILSQLNGHAHIAASSNSEDFVLASMVTFEKLPVLLEELLALECWRENVFPRILLHVAQGRSGPGASLRAYFCLHHEEVLVNLLELFLYHDYAATALGDGIVDLIDYCVRRVTHLVSLTHARSATAAASPAASSANVFAVLPSEVWALPSAPASAEAAAAEAAAAAEDSTAQLRRWRGGATLRLAVTAVALLRYLSDHASKLPLTAQARLLDTHDVPLLCVPLIETPPWVQRGTDKARTWFKYTAHAWAPCPAGDLLQLTPNDGQPWLTLHALLMEPALRSRYALSSHRRATLLRVRKYMNEVLLDQLPLLADIQRLLDEVTIAPPAECAAEGGGRLLMEAVAEVMEGVTRRALTAPVDWGGGMGSVAAAAAAGGGREGERVGVLEGSSSSSSSSSSMLKLSPLQSAPAALAWTWEDAAEYTVLGGKGSYRHRRRGRGGVAEKKSSRPAAAGVDLFSPAGWPDSDEDEDLTALGNSFGSEVEGGGGGGEAAMGDPKCAKCGEVATKRCSRCKNEWYCSRECQVSVFCPPAVLPCDTGGLLTLYFPLSLTHTHTYTHGALNPSPPTQLASWEGHKVVCDIVSADPSPQ